MYLTKYLYVELFKICKKKPNFWKWAKGLRSHFIEKDMKNGQKYVEN